MERQGDAIDIPGEYQAQALVSDRAAQRFWHEAKFQHVVAVDSNQAAIDFARGAYPRPNLDFVLGHFDVLRAHGPFNQIYCLEVLEHLYLEQHGRPCGFSGT